MEWISFIPYFCVLLYGAAKDEAPKCFFLYGFLREFSKFVIVYSWFCELYAMNTLDIPKPVIVLLIAVAIVLIPALQSVLFGLCAYLCSFVLRREKSAFLNGIFCAVSYTLCEYLLSFGTFAFPWGVTYISQCSHLPIIQSASVFGGHFITLILVFCDALIAYALFSPEKRKAGLCFIAVFLFTANYVFGIQCLSKETSSQNELSFAVYQDNISSYQKWESDPVAFFYELNDVLKKEKYMGNKNDILVLSETVFTCALKKGREEITDSLEYGLCKLSEAYDTTLICGAFKIGSDKKIYNSLFVFEDGKMSDATYDKHDLVPFGEFVPYEKVLNGLLPFLENFNLSGNKLEKGKKPNVLYSKYGTFGGLICFDSAFCRNVINASRDGAELIILSTNDSWYNDSPAMYQHYSHAVMRAVESGKCVVRCATTGISGIIDEKGRTLTKTGPFEKTLLHGQAGTNGNSTAFVRFGYSYLYALSVLCGIYFILSAVKVNNKKQKCKQIDI